MSRHSIQITVKIADFDSEKDLGFYETQRTQNRFMWLAVSGAVAALVS